MTQKHEWFKTQTAIDLKTSVIGSDAGVRREIAQSTAVLFHRVNAVKMVSSKALPEARTGIRDETPHGDGDGKIRNSGAGSGSVRRSSS